MIKIPIHTNAFRDLDYLRAVDIIELCWPGQPIEASTCREHLHRYLTTWDETQKISYFKSSVSEVSVLSGGWCDFVRGEGLGIDGMFDRQAWLAENLNVLLRVFLAHPNNEPEATPENIDRAVQNLMLAADMTEVDLAIENHGGITADPGAMNEILYRINEGVGYSQVGTVLDPINYARCGWDPVRVLKAINFKLIKHVHAKDMTSDGKLCTPGDGLFKEEWRVIARYLRDNGYKGAVTLEYEGDDIMNGSHPGYRVEKISRGLRFLEEIFNG